MTVPKLLIDENTKVIINISTLVIVVGFAITATFSFTTWKTQAEQKDIFLQEQIVKLEESTKEKDNELKDEIQVLKIAVEENKTNMIEIKTDVKWIRAYMEKDSQ